jgi:hypothetical protein
LKLGDCEEPREIARDGGVHEIVKKTQTNKQKIKANEETRRDQGMVVAKVWTCTGRNS